MKNPLLIIIFILVSGIAGLFIHTYSVHKKLEAITQDKEYLLMQQDQSLRELNAIRERLVIEDSLRSQKLKLNDEKIRLIRAATTSDLQHIIERAAADTTRLRLLR